MKDMVTKRKVAACLQKKHLLPRKQLKEEDKQEHSLTENFTSKYLNFILYFKKSNEYFCGSYSDCIVLEKFYSKTEILIREISKTDAHADKEY